MRRSIDSDYIRKKRYSRRPRDNWRKIKSRGKKMESDKHLWTTGIVLLIMWAMTLSWMVWEVFK